MDKAIFSSNEVHRFNAVLEQVCRDLKIADETRRSRLQENILLLAKEGVRDFETLHNYAAQPRINRFSMVDPG